MDKKMNRSRNNRMSFEMPQFLEKVDQTCEKISTGVMNMLRNTNGSMFQSSSSSQSAHIFPSCQSCSSKFNLFRSRRVCTFCGFEFCTQCFLKQETVNVNSLRQKCLTCRIITLDPPDRSMLMNLPVRDLISFLQSKRIAFRHCNEKNELVELILAYRRGYQITSGSASGTNSTPFNSAPPSDHRSSTNQSTTRTNEQATTHEHNNQANSGQRSYESNSSSDWEFVDNVSNEASQRSTPSSSGSSHHDFTTVELDDLSSTNAEPGSPHSSSNYSNQTNLSSAARNLITEEHSYMSRSFDSNRPANLTISNQLNSELSQSAESLTSGRLLKFENIKSEQDIRDLSVRQLKLLLVRNCVNYQGACEKKELQDKAILLWKQACDEAAFGENIPDENLCKICMDKFINCVLLDCGHSVCCIDCGKRLNECPICRQFVVRSIRIFKA